MSEAKGAASVAPHVFIAIPSYSGTLAKETMESLIAAEDLLRSKGWVMTVSILPGDCYIQHARNTLVATFMETKADSLFFVDDDVVFPADAMLSLLEMPDEFVFATYPLKRSDEGYPVVIHTDAMGYPVVRKDGCISATGAPTGFMRLKRSVIEKMQSVAQKYDEYDDHGRFVRTAYDLFPQGAKHGRWWGEDIAFCNLWTSILGQIWCVPNVDMGHVGKNGHVYRGNYHEFLLRQPKVAA